MQVSVIIPTYNMEEYIGKCVESIMSQTLMDIEVICIDDGSTDNTAAVVQELQKKYANLLYVWQTNSGSGKARNMGMLKARGEFVAFMDADDFYYSADVLEELYNTAKEKSVLICGGSACNYRDGIITYEGIRKGNTFEHDGYVKYTDYQVPYGFWKFIYKRDFLIENNIIFPNYIRCQDPPFFVKAMITAEEFYAISKICYCYRKEHKKIFFDTKKIKDYASGMRDVLILSRENRLSVLHTEVINELHNEVAALLYREIANGNKALEYLVNEINENIDESLICKKKLLGSKLYLVPIEEIETYVNETEKRKKYFIEDLKKNESVYVYGAGLIGKRILRFLTEEKVNVNAVLVSSKNQNPDFIGDVAVKEIASVTIKEKDVVLIATFPYLHEEIEQMLLSKNVTNYQKIDVEEFIMYEKELTH